MKIPGNFSKFPSQKTRFIPGNISGFFHPLQLYFCTINADYVRPLYKYFRTQLGLGIVKRSVIKEKRIKGEYLFHFTSNDY